MGVVLMCIADRYCDAWPAEMGFTRTWHALASRARKHDVHCRPDCAPGTPCSILRYSPRNTESGSGWRLGGFGIVLVLTVAAEGSSFRRRMADGTTAISLAAWTSRSGAANCVQTVPSVPPRARKERRLCLCEEPPSPSVGPIGVHRALCRGRTASSQCTPG